MDIRDRWSGLFWLFISLSVLLNSIQLGIGSFSSPGPGFLLFWAAVIIGLLAIPLVVKGFLKKREGKIVDLWKGYKWSRVIFVFISLLLYSALLSKIGYLLTTFGLMMFLFSILGRRRIWTQVITAFITVLGTYLVFRLWLKVQLPIGIFGF